jgi:formamidopyrimidine-DNA glycosylase
MPELPEVETIARGLAPELEGRTVADGRRARAAAPHARRARLRARLRGRTLGRMGRTGKYLGDAARRRRTLARPPRE